MYTNDGVWLTIAEYSRLRKISVSTIRRHIKSSILKHKMEDGKYYVYASKERLEKCTLPEMEVERLIRENLELKKQLKLLQEERDELSMLTRLYEQEQKVPTIPVQ